MITMEVNLSSKKVFNKEGFVSYNDFGGTGETVICLPSLGDIKEEFRFLVPKLKEQGFRVITVDLRGHGESDKNFSSYTPEDIVSDLELIYKNENITNAALIGCSISGGVIATFASNNPTFVNKLIMINPFVRDMPFSNLIILLGKILLIRPWGVFIWGKYYSSLYPTLKPNDFEIYLKKLKENLSIKGRLEAVVKMFSASKKNVEKSLSKVLNETLILMGEKDLDFPKPLEEAKLISDLLGKAAKIKVLNDLGHYPHAENVDITSSEIIKFLMENENV